MKEAPIFTAAYDLHRWLLERLAEVSRHELVRMATLTHSGKLLDTVVLALERRGERRLLEQADESALLLRIQLKLANELGLLEDRQWLFASNELASIGRQLGGWLKKAR
jgi:hypothetical protein